MSDTPVVAGPKTFGGWLSDFLDRRWGDINGMALITAGSAIVLLSKESKDIFALGNSLILAGAAMLRPKSFDRSNGNGNGTNGANGK